MNQTAKVTSPTDAALDALCETLSLGAGALERPGAWPAEQLELCGQHGVFEWFVPQEFGGQEWDAPSIAAGYLRLSAACLTTTFVITQLTGACQRIVASGNEYLLGNVLPDLVSGESLATLGISHLTTSGQHLRKPALLARELPDRGIQLDGISPWVTGAAKTQFVVTGATLDDGRQLLAIIPTDMDGVHVPPPANLVALTASQTGPVHFRNVQIPSEYVLAGPMENVMGQGVGARTGGLQTSTLALGLARAAVEFLAEESRDRPDLVSAAEQLDAEWLETQRSLMTLADGSQAPGNAGDLRAKSNSLVLRATQSALVAAKGAGFVTGHVTGRWCREALFFLVWSCPQPVAAANLCEFAGLAQ